MTTHQEPNGPTKQLPPVAWFDLVGLWRTVLDAGITSILAGRLRVRDMQAYANAEDPFAYSLSDGHLWIDYVADVGDAFDPTFVIARLLALPSLLVPLDGSGASVSTQRGRALIMGGDQVYPAASRDAYRERLLAPYGEALRGLQVIKDDLLPAYPARPDDQPAHLFAIPGNHDWYDGLVAFQRLFCQSRTILGRKTLQSRSYFAMQLPKNWWIWALDVELEADINRSQRRYFEKIAESFPDEKSSGDQQRLILLVAEPHWLKGETQENLAFLERTMLKSKKARIEAVIAGDYHHYQRHESQEESGVMHWIVAGGGGAFLHPTHGSLSPDTVEMRTIDEQSTATEDAGPRIFDHAPHQLVHLRRLTISKRFPEKSLSQSLAKRIAGFALQNRSAALIAGALYLWLAGAWLEPLQLWMNDSGPFPVFEILTIRSVVASLVSVLVPVALAQGHLKRHWLAGLIHGGAHIAVASSLAFLFAALEWTPASGLLSALLGWTAMLLSGAIVGGTIIGFYFMIALEMHGAHGNEVFSSLRIPDYKCFLRFHFADDGSCEIYPIGVTDVAKAKAALEKEAPVAEWHLIEKPIVLGRIGGRNQ
jgi:hypothetical protein